MAKRPPISPAKPQTAPHPQANFWRRLGAWLYDALIVLALLMVGGALGLGVANLLVATGLATLKEGEDAAHLLQHPLYSAWLAAIMIGFYGWFWVRGGQTIGMRAWRLRIQNQDGSNIRVTQALIRMATSAFGLGNLLALFGKRAFQDIWAECEVVVLSKEENRALLDQE